MLDDEAPEPRPCVVDHVEYTNRRGGVEGRIYFYEYRDSRRWSGDLINP